MAASAFIATPPTSTHENALSCFLLAEEKYLEKERAEGKEGQSVGYWIDNSYQAAQMYQKIGNRAKHKEWLLKAAAFTVSTSEDMATLAAVKQQLELARAA
jgi:hypothetical protein